MWIAILSSAITAAATLAATAVGWSLHQKGTKADARRDLYEELLLMVTEFQGARQRGKQPTSEWIEKFQKYFVKIQLLDKSSVRRSAVLLYEMILDYILGKGNFDEVTFDARQEMLIYFMREDLSRVHSRGAMQAIDNWRKRSGLDQSIESYEAAVRAVLGFNQNDAKIQNRASDISKP